MKKLFTLLLIVRCMIMYGQVESTNALNKLPKAFLGMQLEQPFIAFKNYGLHVITNSDGFQEFYFENEKSTPSFKNVATSGGNVQFAIGKLKSFELYFNPDDNLFDSLTAYFTSLYGSPTPGNDRFSNSKNTWESNDYRVDVIQCARLEGTMMYHIPKVEFTSKKLIRERDKHNEKVRLQAELKEKNYRERQGRGNGSFVPDITSTIKVILASATTATFEKLLPLFTVTPADTTYSFNKLTNEYDIFSSIRYTYSFKYKDKIPVIATVETKKNGSIIKIEYRFSYDPFFRFEIQRKENNLVINEPMTKMVTKMGLNECTVYDNSQKIHLTIYNSSRFTISKYE